MSPPPPPLLHSPPFHPPIQYTYTPLTLLPSLGCSRTVTFLLLSSSYQPVPHLPLRIRLHFKVPIQRQYKQQ